jgi:hypothetical protein
MSKYYNLKTSMEKTKIMAFKGKHLVLSKIQIDGKILEKVKQFNYLGCELSLSEPYVDKKINRFQHICNTIRRHLKKTRTDTQMKFYKVVARPTLLIIWYRNMDNQEARHDWSRSCRDALSKKC